MRHQPDGPDLSRAPRGHAGARLPASLLWIALLTVAAALRLTHLAAAPLSPVEAARALAAYSAGRGLPLAVGTQPGAPLLLHVNTLLFTLFDGGDGVARLLPALAGVGLVLTPLLLRGYLGRWGALGTGLMLALSPTALLFSRSLDGTVPAALGVMLLLGCAARFLDTQRHVLATLGGLGLAWALAAGPGVWGLLLGLVIALGAGLWVWWEQVPWVWPLLRPALGRGLVGLGAGLLVVGTGLGCNPAGLAGAGEQLLAWLARFGAPTGAPSPSPAILLLAYEPLILVAGLAGLVLALGRRHGMGLLLAFWAVVGGLQLALMPGREPADLLWVLLPLAGLGGLAVEELAEGLAARGRWLNEGLHLAVSLILWVHCALALARYARFGTHVDLFLAALTVVLQILLTAVFGFAVSVPEPGEGAAKSAGRGAAVALRAGGLSLAIVLVALTFSTGWGLTHLRPADPAELLAQGAAAPEIRTLAEVVAQVSLRSTGAETGLPVTLLGDADPALLWALRRFDLHLAGSVQPVRAELPPLVVTTSPEAPPADYHGTVFARQRAWAFPRSGQDVARWWLYRQADASSIAVDKVALWVREDLATAE
jgi:hypothetical protein